MGFPYCQSHPTSNKICMKLKKKKKKVMNGFGFYFFCLIQTIQALSYVYNNPQIIQL